MIEKVMQDGVEYKVEKVGMKEGTKFIDLGPRGNAIVSVRGRMVKVTIPNSESNVGNLNEEQALELADSLKDAVEVIKAERVVESVERELRRKLSDKERKDVKELIELMKKDK